MTTCDFPLMDVLVEKATEKNIPLIAALELTHSCNVRCSHCYIVDDHQEEMSSQEIALVLDQLADMGTLFLSLTGGEILTRTDWFDIATYARKKGFALRLLTNGTLITDEVADKIKVLRPLSVEISLYGANRSTHERITRVKGSYELTMNAFRLLRQRSIPTILKCPVIRENVGEIRDIVSLAQKLDVEWMLDVMIFPKVDGCTEPFLHRASDEGLRSFFSDMLSISNDHEPLEDFDPVVEYAKPKRRKGLCGAGLISCSISPMGDVFPCLGWQEVLGNLRDKSFQEIWNSSDRLIELRSLSPLDVRVCRSCERSEHCARCPGISFLEDGDLLGPSHEACRIAKAKKGVITSWQHPQEVRDPERKGM